MPKNVNCFRHQHRSTQIGPNNLQLHSANNAIIETGYPLSSFQTENDSLIIMASRSRKPRSFYNVQFMQHYSNYPHQWYVLSEQQTYARLGVFFQTVEAIAIMAANTYYSPIEEKCYCGAIKLKIRGDFGRGPLYIPLFSAAV